MPWVDDDGLGLARWQEEPDDEPEPDDVDGNVDDDEPEDDPDEAHDRAVAAALERWAVERRIRLKQRNEFIFKSQIEDEIGVKQVNDFLIGCDPEFVVFKDAHAVNLAYKIGHDGPIGYDHGGWVGEIRPEPTKSAWTLVKRIKELVGHEKLAGIGTKLRAGACVDIGADKAAAGRNMIVLGGHVHIDINPFKPGKGGAVNNQGVWQDNFDPEDDVANRGYNYTYFTSEHGLRMRALDCLTARFEALDILPKAESARRRKADVGGIGYGKWGNFRLAGGDGVQPYRSEYRTMASWLFSPAITYLCLTGAKLAAAKPIETIDLLGKQHTIANLRRVFENFAPYDNDARRVVEKVFGKPGRLHADPDVDFREPWSRFKIRPEVKAEGVGV